MVRTLQIYNQVQEIIITPDDEIGREGKHIKKQSE